MAKLTLDDIASGYGTTVKINGNNAAIETAMENTLSRDGTGPNQMEANLDMNGYKVSNLAAPTADTDAARLIDLTNSYGLQVAPSPVGQSGKGLVSDGTNLVYSIVLTGASALNASNLTSGTVPAAAFPAALPVISGAAVINLNATYIATGTLADGRLSSNVARKNALSNFTAGLLQVNGIEVGYLDISPVAASANYAITSADRGKLIISTAGGFTIPTTITDAAFSNGAAVSICNNSAGSMTITCPASVTLYIAGTATGGVATNRTIAVRGLATLVRIGTASWLISGSGIS